jgi:aryl-alcohol dehydrogenase-like predicted oxidoreductase
VDLGCNFFDSAWHYGSGHSEELLGELVRCNPKTKLYVATKIPPKNLVWPARPEFTLDDCYPPEHIEKYVRISLKNLGMESVDLIQFHTWSDAWLEDDRWAKKIDELRRQGLFQAVGMSLNRWEPWNGVRAVKSGLMDSVQVMYNIFDQNPEDELFPACAAMDVAVIARCPLDQGSLTGTLTLNSRWPEGDWRNKRFSSETLKKSVEHADALKPLLPESMTLPEMALRFILNNPMVSNVIPGMRKARNVEENLRVASEGPLPPELYAELRKHRWDRGEPRPRI